MKIGLVSREYPLETGWGGIGKYTCQLAKRLVNKGHIVHVICQSLGEDKKYVEDGVSVHRISHPNFFLNRNIFGEFARRLEYSWKVFQKIKEINQRVNLDIIEGPNYSAECFIYSFFKGVPLVTRIHTPYEEVIRNFKWKMTLDRRCSCELEKILAYRSDNIICSTDIYRNNITEKYKLNPNKVKTIPLGIKKVQRKRENINKNGEERINILFVGRLEKRKGIHILFKAIPKIVEHFPDVEFNIVGRDCFFQKNEISFRSEKDKSFKTEFFDKLPGKIKSKIKLTGFIKDEELREYYRSCDIFVAPSLHETFGYVYLEAMSYGKLVIGCRVGGVPEVILNGKTGLLVPPSDVNRLTKAVIKLIKDENLRKRMGENARNYVEANFSIERMVKNTISNYKLLIKE